jgi:hypothetical protein
MLNFLGPPLSKRSSVAVGSLASPTVAALVSENAGIADVARAAIRRDAAGVATAAQALAASTEDLVDKSMFYSFCAMKNGEGEFLLIRDKRKMADRNRKKKSNEYCSERGSAWARS